MSRTSPSAAQRTFLALSCVGASLSPFAAAAQTPDNTQAETGQAAEGRALGTVTVTDSAIVEPLDGGRELESPKRTRPVRDTPQTVTVLTNEVIEQQNLLTLRDVLSTVPGITFGAGEGGGGYGDSINLRGFNANNDITVDGVRDSAQYTRTDPFNLEQVEVTNGANSVISGAGSVGGNINLVTKRPLAETRYNLTAGVGTDRYNRSTVDLNHVVNDFIGVRLNGMVHRNDVPGRDYERFRRWGVAPSVALGVGGPTRVILQYLHQEDDNVPQYGVPFYLSATNDGPLPGVSRSAYFGYRNVDRQKINIDQATLTFEHDFSDTMSIRNLSRFQDVRQDVVVNPPQGTYCLANNLTPTGGSCTLDLDTRTGPTQVLNITVPAGFYLPSGPRGTTRVSRNQLMFNQLDATAVFNTGPVEHTFVAGGAFAWEQFNLASGNSLRTAAGVNPYAFDPARPSATAHLPYINISNPNDLVVGPSVPGAVYGSNFYGGPLNFIPGALQRGEQDNYAVYLFDTMKLDKFELNAGIRVERNSGTFRADTVSTSGATIGEVTTVGTTFENKDTLVSYRVGLVYKPVEAISIYAAYGNSETPSKASVNGSCDVNSCVVDPETAQNYEIGAKAELGEGILVSVAAFRNERDRYRVASNDPVIPEQVLEGQSRVDGISLSAIGNVTDAWQITANYTYLDGELRQSVSDFCIANPGRTGCNNSAAFPDPGAGAELANTPKHSGSLFTTYRLPFGLSIGYGLTYQGRFAFGTPSATNRTVIYSDDYLIHQAYAAFELNESTSIQLNVKNFTDEEYYTRIRNNGWATPGDGRAFVLSLNSSFR